MNETDEEQNTQAAQESDAKGIRASRVHHRRSNRSSDHHRAPLKVNAKSRAQSRRKTGGGMANDLERPERDEPRRKRSSVETASGQSQRQREEQHAEGHEQEEHGRRGVGELLGRFAPSHATWTVVEEAIQRVGMALLAPRKRKQMRKKLKKLWREHGSELLATVATALLSEVVSAVNNSGKKKRKKH